MTQTLSPQQLAQDGKEAFEREEYPVAAGFFEAAAAAYAEADEPLMAAEMSNNLSVALLQAGEAEAALAAIGETPDLFSQAGDTRRQAMAIGNKAAALAELNRKDEAEKLYRESAQLLEQIGETDLKASVLQSISRLQLRSGRYMEAVASMQSGLEDVEKPGFTQRLLKKLLRLPYKLLNR